MDEAGREPPRLKKPTATYFNVSEAEAATVELSSQLSDFTQILEGGFLASLEVYH